MLARIDPFTGKITVVRTPARPAVDNLFTFNSSAEMRTVFSLLYERGNIDRILQDLANSAHSGDVNNRFRADVNNF